MHICGPWDSNITPFNYKPHMITSIPTYEFYLYLYWKMDGWITSVFVCAAHVHFPGLEIRISPGALLKAYSIRGMRQDFFNFLTV